MSLNFRNIVQYCFCQEKDLEKTETKVAVAEEEEIREEAGKLTPVWSEQDFLKVKVQKSSFDMLRTLQWTGCTRHIKRRKTCIGIS